MITIWCLLFYLKYVSMLSTILFKICIDGFYYIVTTVTILFKICIDVVNYFIYNMYQCCLLFYLKYVSMLSTILFRICIDGFY